ncbi:hypothetical protein AADZ90_005330 [Aestuariibius sp. 2305UL40-4]|uniref:hypothetical protein n=1 Tax=Aestuariibius violaceus TaxID=3234132 RepID=UPI00346E51AC
MQDAQYSLVLEGPSEKRDYLFSADADLLREIGMRCANDLEVYDDLILVSPCGRELDRFDIWTSQWQGEAA